MSLMTLIKDAWDTIARPRDGTESYRDHLTSDAERMQSQREIDELRAELEWIESEADLTLRYRGKHGRPGNIRV